MIIERGDIFVCIQKNWTEFTYGKRYELLSGSNTESSSLIDVISDHGERCFPALYGYYNAPHKEPTYNFIPLADWRDKQIDYLCDNEKVS